jgi:hypothetical protein
MSGCDTAVTEADEFADRWKQASCLGSNPYWPSAPSEYNDSFPPCYADIYFSGAIFAYISHFCICFALFLSISLFSFPVFLKIFFLSPFFQSPPLPPNDTLEIPEGFPLSVYYNEINIFKQTCQVDVLGITLGSIGQNVSFT